jgi:hypothetical protein
MSTEDSTTAICLWQVKCEHSVCVCDPDSLGDVIQLFEESGQQFLKNSFGF